MRPGTMDRLVTLERFTETRDPTYGTVIEAWAPLATLWAEVRQQGGREFLATDMLHAERRVVFFLRWFPALTVLDRVAFEGRRHDIEEVREIGRRDGVELHTVAAGCWLPIFIRHGLDTVSHVFS